ncbi:MAG TPA: glycosyltransferase family 2 protein [Chitinophagaceae bacterium]|jgi:glycosyltransferase involved in cell wall biosynthesis|nr:glycosyltransferase family 2 protein [Chitinophagaceae bacterium]
MNFPKISIVIPSYNQGQYLEETILSIVKQQYPNLELFVVDGGSNDNSVEVIKKHEQHITWWASEKDNGQSEAINKGFARSTGDIISWLCSDDLYTTLTLHKVAESFSNLPDTIGLLHGAVLLFNDKKEIETQFTYLAPCYESYLSGMVFSQPSAFFKKKYLDRVGYLDHNLHYGMDYDLFMRLSLVSNFHPIEDIYSKYRLHDQSKSVAQNNRFIKDWKRSFVSLCKNLSWHDELEFLKQTGLFDDEITYQNAFSFQPEQNIVSSVNRKKALCFHLGHVVKDLYWIGKFVDAGKLMKTMQRSFPIEWMKEDTRLMAVMTKLRLPQFALNSLKRIKRILH